LKRLTGTQTARRDIVQLRIATIENVGAIADDKTPASRMPDDIRLDPNSHPRKLINRYPSETGHLSKFALQTGPNQAIVRP
jgi:hypothetical protein